MFNESDSSFYDTTYYQSMERRYVSGAQLNKVHEVFKMLGNIRGKKILDLGCGGGFFVNEASKRGAEVIGVDYAESAVTFARERFPRLDIRLADAYTLSEFQEGEFDIVMLIDILEHISGQAKVLTEIRRILRPGGLVIISTDLDDTEWNRNWMKRAIWGSLRFSRAGRAYLGLKREEASAPNRRNYHASHIGLLTFDDLLRLFSTTSFRLVRHKVFPVVSVPLRDWLFRLLPKNWRGDHQLILAERIN